MKTQNEPALKNLGFKEAARSGLKRGFA